MIISYSDCPTLKFSTKLMNENATELNLGMKAVIRITLTCPPGSYDLVEIRISRKNKHIDIGDVICQTGSQFHRKFRLEQYIVYYKKVNVRFCGPFPKNPYD
jgi:hypothetical protein